MESVIFDGKEYVKASVLATRFRYTADYLGQLCRGKKVDARLVGRAWYINLDSLNLHRSGRYKSAPAKEEAEFSVRKPPSHYLSRIDVEPILRKKTVSLVKSTKGVWTELSVKYEGDDHSLIPRVNKEAVSKNIPVNPADAERVKIQKEKSPITSFKAEALPEVYLRGAINVAGLEEATEAPPEIVEKIEPEIKLERIPETPKPKQVFIRQLKKPLAVNPTLPTAGVSRAPLSQVTRVPDTGSQRVQDIAIKIPFHKHAINQQPLVHPTPLVATTEKRPENKVFAPVVKRSVLRPINVDVVNEKVAPPNFKPQVVLNNEAKKAVTPPAGGGWFTPIFGSGVAILIAVWILGARAEISAERGTYQEHWKFDIDLLRERF
jgi:hypothetical protein